VRGRWSTPSDRAPSDAPPDVVPAWNGGLSAQITQAAIEGNMSFTWRCRLPPSLLRMKVAPA